MNDNIQKLYGALQKYGYGDLGTADEFGAKVQDDNNRRKLYDALSRDGFSDLGSYEEFSGRLMQGGPAQETAQPAAPAQEQSATAAPAVDPAEQKRNAEEGRAMFDRMRESRRPATSPVPVQPQAGQAQEPAQSEEPAPAPAETASSANAKADEKEQLKKKMADLEQVLEAVRGDADFADEYEGRKSERDRRAKELGSLRGDIRGSGFDPSQLDEDNRYISENESRYGKAVEDRKAARQVQADIDAIKGRILQIEGEESKKRIDAKRKDINMRVPGTGRNAVTMGSGGFATYPEDLNEMKDDANYFAADQILGMADQQWSQGSKNDEGYRGNDLEKLWTAVSQFASGAAKEVDLGTFTLGLSEGSALMAARKVGEKYNGLINSAIKDMKMSDGDMDMLMSHLDANGRKLEDLGAELDRAGAELETMKSTYEDLVNRGDPKARAYGREYQKKVDAYNKLINDEYKPLRAEYENDRAAYQKVMEAVDSAVQNGLSDSERAVLDALDEFTNAKAARADDASTASKAGAGFEQSLEFMLDFLLTKGVGKAGTKAATKIAKNRMLKKVGAEALKDMTVKPGLGLRMATDAASAAVRTAVMVPRNLKAYGDQLAEYTGKDELGRINFDKSRLDAALNTAVTQYIEYWSEGFGEYFGEAEQALFRNVTKAAPKTAIGQTLKNYRGSIGKYLDYGKFDGMFNEMMEEAVGSTFNALSGWLSNDRVGDKDALKDFFAGENLATMALSFLPMSAIGAVTNLSAYHKMKNRYDEGVKMLNGFVNSGILEREEVEALTANISDMTPEQIKGNIVKLADKARERNGGALPSDFAKNMLGYVEGSFAMDLRHDEWEDSKEKMAVVGAYTESYSRPDVSFAWDADQAEEEAKSAALSAGFTEEELDADPFILGQDAAALRDTEPERSKALSDYAVAKARSEGLRNGFMDSVDRDAEEYGNSVRQNLDRDGIIVMANMNENGNQVPVFVMSTDAIIGQDGKITTPTGDDGLVTIRRGEEAEPETVKASELSGADVQMTDVFVTEQVDAIKARANEFYEAARKAVSPAGQQRMLEQRVGTNVVVSGDGAFMPVRVERMKADEGKVVISGDKEAIKAIATATNTQSAGGTMLEVGVADLWPHLSREEDGSLTTFEQEPSAEGKAETAAQPQQEQAPKVNPDELPDTDRTVMIDGRPTTVHVDSVGGDGVWYTYRDEQGVEREGDMSLDAFTAALVDEQAQAPAAENPVQAPAQTNAFPVDEKTGKRVFDHPSVTPERAYRELMDGVAPGSKNEANRRKFIESSTAKAANALAEAQNKIAGLQARRDAVDQWDINDDEDIDAFEERQNKERAKIDAQIAEVEAQVPELQRRAAHWAAVRDMAGAVSSERKDARLTDRAAEWSKRTGVKARVFRSPEEIDDKTVRDALAQGERVGGWYNPRTGEVGLYLPNLADEAEVAKTFIHEVISHKGLRDMLGKENYDALCDKVWDQLMSEEDRKKYLAYNSHLKGSEEFLRRAAADEWIAHFSETLGLEENKNLFDKFVEFVKEFLDRVLGEDAKISKDDLANLLRSSLARYESERPAIIEAELSNSGIAANGDDIRFSVRYVPSQDEVGKIAKEISTTMGITEEQSRKWVESEMSLAAIITGYQEFLNYKADDRYTAIKNDSDYPQGTVDFNNICRKRLDFTEMYQRIQRAFPNTIITGEDLATIRNIMKKHGLTVACGLCYVEDRRQLLGEIAKDFIDNVAGNFKKYESKGGETKKKNAEKFRSLIGDDRKDDLSIYDLISLDGSTKLNQEHPGIYKAFQAFNSARGQQAGNLFQGYAEYKREILKWSDAKVKRVNDNGGLRIFSYSDFEAHHLIDIVQIVIDCARRGVKIQGYTKVPAFARAVANTGIKLNRSLIPLGDTGIVDGKLAYDPVEGIDINDPDFLESNDNIGNILIGINDEQIRLAMADPFVHYIIPYHSNQSGVLRGMKQTGKWTNYKNEQTEKGENVGKHGVNIYTDVLNAAEAEGKPITNEREFTEKFLAVCKEKGWTPRFARFLNTNEAGEYVYTPGYYKLLLDFKLFDENGNILPQKPVVAEFDDEFNAKILMDYVAEQQERKTRDLDPVYDEIIDELDLESRTPKSVDDGGTVFRKVTSPGTIKRLEDGPKVKVYRSMQFVPDPNGDVEHDLGDGKGVQKGFLYAPMSAKVDGKWRDPIQLGRWEEAEENPDMADENGEFILDKGDGSGPMKVAYAPYLHTRRSPLNEQFSSAYKRGNLVIVESEIPESELSSNYTAEKSKKSTGEHDWPSGKVSNALAKKGMDTRKVILSRWAKPVRLVPNSEVADEIVKLLGKSKLAFPYNVVTPGLRSELKSRGVRFKGWQGNKPKNVDELIAEMERADENNVRFRITPEQDKEYMDAVNAGDMATAQEMVDAAAEAAGYTVRGYHGTTHNFTIFDRSKGNAEGDWGKGFYFTTSRDDADVNYGTDEGPDLTNRIELLAENMEWMDGYEDLDYEERLEKAREMLAGDNPHTISAAVRMENPLIIDSHQGAKETFFDYNSGYNYETDEYEDEESGLLLDFINAWNEELDEWEWEGNYASPEEILEYADDGGLTASQLEMKAREILDSAGIRNSAGELASGEFLRSVFERMGFDGIIDENVNIKFGGQRKYGRGMDGMDYDTAHIIAFTPEQIKQTDPVTYDDAGNVIPLSERFNPENNDIRFRRNIDPESQELFDAAKERFGTTRDLHEAGYILPDGAMLDFSGRHMASGDTSYLNGSRTVDHRDIEDLNFERDLNTPSGRDTNMADFIGRGAIRIHMPGMINLAVKPTPEQVSVLERLINADNRFVRVEFGNGYNSKHFADYDDARPVRVINDIKRYFDEGYMPSGNIRFRVSDEVDVPSVSANLYDAYENQNGEDKPWMSEQELIDRIEAELPYGIDTKELFSKIDEYRRLDDEDFDEGRRDFSGSERDSVFQEILSGLNGLAESGRAETSKEDLEKAERIAAAERVVTGKMLDSMPQVIGAGVMQVSRDKMPAGHKTDKGYYNPETNTVSVCMDNVLDERDAVATVIHETVGRKGLEDLFGDQYHDAMASSYAALDAEGRSWVNTYILRNGLKPGDGGILRGMEEYMARLAARDGGPVLDAINDILSEAVDFSVGTEGFRFTDRELAYTLLASYEHSKNPNWLDTPAGKAQDTLWKREYGINESDPNRPTDPDGPDAGTRFRRGTGDAVDRYEERMKDWKTIAMMEIQNADIPVKAGYEEILKEKFGDQWEKRMKGLRSDEDYLMRHNLSSSRADTENHNFKLFHFDPMIEKVREVQRKLVGKNASQQKLQDAYERVLDYLYAVSGLERNEWERNNGGEAKDWSGLTSLMGRTKEEWQEAEADARAMVDAFKAEVGDDALLDQLWDAIRSCTDFSLDHAYKYGLITKSDYERLRGANGKPRLWNYYLPLRGFTQRTAEEEFDYAGIIGNRSQNDEVVKEAKGRWTEADNPLAYIANIAQKEIVQGNENWARQALLRFVRNVGENSLLSERKPWYVKVAGPSGGAVWTLAEPWDIDPSTGRPETIEHFEERMQGLKKTGDARQGRKGLELGLVMANQGHRNQHLIHVKVGGEDRMIWVNGNPALARAVSGAGKEPNYEMWRRASRVISNTFTTYSLDFTAKNLLRDSIYSLLGQMVKEDRKYMARYFTNWLGNGGFTAAPMIRLAALWDSGELQRKDPSKLTRKERMFIDFMHDGGQTGYTIVRNVEKMKKAIEKTLAPSTLSRVVDGAKFKVAGVDVPVLGIYTWGVRTLNEAFELLTRFTAYETSRDMGRDGQRAAYDAKEISVNFNRRGAQSNKNFWGKVAAYFGGTHYFFNAGIQGFDNFLRLYKTNPRAFGVESAAIMALGFFTPLINALISGGGDGDDDKEKFNWYWNLPEWVRRNNIVLGYDNKYLAIPLPVEFRALYGLGDITNSVFLSHTYPNPFPGNMFLDIVSTASGILPVNPIEGYNGKSVDLKDAVLRSVVPDLTIFFVDWATNQDYTGRQLKKENMFTPNVPKSQGAYASTPKALVEACQWMGEHFGVDWAPGVVRDFLSNYGGGFYKFAEDLSKRMFTDDDHPKRWDDIPFLSGFTGHIDEDRTVTYVNGVLNEYKDLADGIVTKMNLYNNSSDIKGKQAFVDTDELPAKAKVQALLSGKDYRIAQAYYKGMEDEHTGQKGKVRKTYKTGKRAGKSYTTTQEIVIPGVNSKKKAWKEAREKWSSLPDGSQEKAQAYADVTNAWHEYYNAAADLAQLLMDMEYGKIEFE